jgi:DNA-binding GntR family transcriptional regulator
MRKPVVLPISRKDIVVEILRESILSCERAAGSRLNLDDIAEHLNVSRMPVREALKQLEVEGLVTIYPHRGVEVSELAIADIEEIFEIRTLLEQKAVEKGIANLTQANLDEMKVILIRMDAIVGNAGEWLELNTKFHNIINVACGWPRLIEMIDVLRVNVDRYLRTYWRLLGYERPQAQHWALYEACLERDIVRAKAIVGDHFKDTSAALVSVLNVQHQSGDMSPPARRRRRVG